MTSIRQSLLMAFIAALTVGCAPSHSYSGYSYEESREADYARGGGGDDGETVQLAAAPEKSGGGGLFDEVYEPVGGEVERRRARPASAVEKTKLEPVDTAQADEEPVADQEGQAQDPAGTGDDPGQANERRRIIIYTADLVVGVLEIEPAIETVNQLVKKYDGWVQASDSQSVVARVPAEQFDAFLAEVRELGRVDRESIRGNDVTEEYLDLEIRLKNALDLRERYVQLLDKAETVKEALAIETELGRLTGEIERLKGRIRFLQQHASFSTVTVRFQQRTETRPQGKRHVELPFPWLRSYNLREVYSNRKRY